MKEQTVTITHSVGLHARPAALLVKTASAFKSDLALVKGDRSFNAKSLLAVMGAAVKSGETVTIRAGGEDEDAAVAAVAALINSNFGES